MTNRFASLETFKPDVLEETPAPPLERIDEAAARHGFSSREPLERKKRTPKTGPSDQINIRASIADINTFIEWCERNRFTNRQGFAELVRRISSER